MNDAVNVLEQAAQRMIDAFAPHANNCRPCTIEWQNLKNALERYRSAAGQEGQPIRRPDSEESPTDGLAHAADFDGLIKDFNRRNH